MCMCVHRSVSATTGVGSQAQGVQQFMSTGQTRACEGSERWPLDKGSHVLGVHVFRLPATVETGVDTYGVCVLGQSIISTN